MKRYATFFCCLAILLSACASLTAQDKYMIMSVKGKVEAGSAKGKNWKKVEVGQVLGNGDIIRTSFASYVKLMVNENRLVSIDENTTRPLLEYSAKRNPASGNGSTAGKILQYAAQQIRRTKDKKSGTDFGAVRGGESVFTAVFPKNRIMTTTPLFQWVDATEAPSYTIIIQDASFATIEKQTVKERTLRLPEGSAMLASGGSYYWRVIRDSDGEASNIESFSVLASDTIKTIGAEVERLKKELSAMHSDEITMHLILAMYFDKQGLYTDAFQEYKATITLAPDVEEYRQMMANLLLKLRLYVEEEFLLR
jgi:hypothetical protein